MKQILKISAITTLCVALFAAFGCEKQLPFCGGGACKTPLSASTINCSHTSFLSGIDQIKDWSKIELYIVKGEALDAYKHGRKIKLIEDLIGNFPKNVDTFIVWGNAAICVDGISYIVPSYGRLEYLACYDCYRKGDILIMLLTRTFDPPENWTGTITHWGCKTEWIETSEDFSIVGWCMSSVLWLRNGYVTGFVHSTYDYRNRKHIDRIPWRNFQRELNDVLKIN